MSGICNGNPNCKNHGKEERIEGEGWLEEEREVVREIGARYGERRLSAVPGWWNNKKGMLHDDNDSMSPEQEGKRGGKNNLTYDNIKPVKGAHRRMSTLTSSIRKEKHKGGKEELLKYYR